MSLRSVKKILKQRGELDNLSSSSLHLEASESEEEDPIYYEKTESKQNIFDLVSLILILIFIYIILFFTFI